MTKVINLLGGSGLGKSTTAAGLFYHMKLKGINCELVREYVKNWAWEGKSIKLYDQSYIFGKQSNYESKLYGKVDYIITDSPLLLGTIYESFYNGDSVISESVKKFIKLAENNNVEYINILLERHKPFDTRGRYETKETAEKVDKYIENFLNKENIKYLKLNAIDEERTQEILKYLGV